MTTLEAHAIFFQLPKDDRRLIDDEVNYYGFDAWPAANVAALRLVGRLETARTPLDLVKGVAEFVRMYADGIVDWPTWQTEIKNVLQEVIDWGEHFERSIGGSNGFN